MKTNVMRILDSKNIKYEFFEYEQNPKLSGNDIAKMLNENPEATFKTLITQAKSKEYVEEANFKIGKSTDAAKIAEIRANVYENEAKLEPASSISAPSAIPVSECYLVTSEAMKEWGLENVKLENKEYYLIKFDDTNATVEIYNTLGYDGKYSLTEIDNIE